MSGPEDGKLLRLRNQAALTAAHLRRHQRVCRACRHVPAGELLHCEAGRQLQREDQAAEELARTLEQALQQA